jgi:hypothetical protein
MGYKKGIAGNVTPKNLENKKYIITLKHIETIVFVFIFSFPLNNNSMISKNIIVEIT